MNAAVMITMLSLFGWSLDEDSERRAELKEELKHLQDEAAAQEKEGHKEAVEKLRHRIREIEEKLQADRPEEKVKEKVKAHRAEEAEARERAEKMRREEEESRARQKKQPGEEERRHVKEKIEMLRREAEEAKRAGRGDHAEELWEQSKKLEASLKKPPRPKGEERDEAMALVDQIARLRKEAIHAKREGNPDRAKKVWNEADRLEGKLRQHVSGEEREERGEHRDEREPRRDGDLWREVERLRAEVNELRALLKKAIEK
ncbi:MAG: hypothetical protein HY717_05400 [Planctomycetes bacterium]|nr:hypothetical protein [Planctomycetota bacterium]